MVWNSYQTAGQSGVSRLACSYVVGKRKMWYTVTT